MLYLLATLFAFLASAEDDAARRLTVVPNLVLERDLLDGIAESVAYGAFCGVENYATATINWRRRVETSDSFSDVVEKVTPVELPRRRLVCAGACLAIAAAVAGGIASGVTGGAIGALANNVEAVGMNNNVALPQQAQVDELAMIAAQGAYDAIETQFGISGIETFGDHLEAIMTTPQRRLERRLVCGGVCIAIATAVGAGAAKGIATGLTKIAASSVEAQNLNVDSGLFLSEHQVNLVTDLEMEVIDIVTELGTNGAIAALQNVH